MKKQLFNYALVGAVGTIVHYLVLVVFAEILLVRLWLATTVGFVFGACINYILNYFYTFGSVVAHKKAAPRFFLVASVGMILNAFVFSSLLQVDFFSHYYLLAQMITTLFVMIITFAINKFWTF